MNSCTDMPHSGAQSFGHRSADAVHRLPLRDGCPRRHARVGYPCMMADVHVGANPDCTQEDQASTLKEAQLLSSLEHPNIIKYKECFIDDEGALCIVTSFCEEGDLFRRIRDKAKKNELFAESEVMDMFIQVQRAFCRFRVALMHQAVPESGLPE